MHPSTNVLYKYTCLPLVAYDVIKNMGQKPSVQLMGGGIENGIQNSTNYSLIILAFLLLLVVVCIYYYNERSYRIQRSFGRKFWAFIVILFQTPLYFVYAALNLFIPTMDSTLPLPK